MDGMRGTLILIIACFLKPGKTLPYLLNKIKIFSLKITGGVILSNTLTVDGNSSSLIKLEVDYIIIKYIMLLFITI